MSSIDPSKGGKCWSCKYCEDIGTYRYEDYVSYMRKCTKSGHEYIDDCQRYCSDYVWDGKTPENGSSSSSSSYSSSSSSSSSSYSSSSSSSDSPGCGKVIGIIVGILFAGWLLFHACGGFGLFQGKQTSPATEPSQSTVETTMQVPAVVKTKGGVLKMRSGPSTDDSVVAKIPNGASVTILDENEDGTWALVSYKDKIGWCSAKYLNKG